MNFVTHLTQTFNESSFKFADLTPLSKNLFDDATRWVQQLPTTIEQSQPLTFAVFGIANVIFMKIGDLFATQVDRFFGKTDGSKTGLGACVAYGTVVVLNVALSKVMHYSLDKLAITGVLFCLLLLRKKRGFDQKNDMLAAELKKSKIDGKKKNLIYKH